MAELFVVNGICGGTVFFLPPAPTVLGRTPECQIQIADPWVSSLHARFERRAGQQWVVDLSSRNGTFVDDLRVGEAMVRPGQRLRFGKTVAELRPGADQPAEATDALVKEGTIFRPIDEVRASMPLEVDGEAKRATLGGQGEAEALKVARRQVAVLNEIGKSLTDAPDLDACLTSILRTVARAVRAERSCLLLNSEGGGYAPRAYFPADSPPRISNTLLEAAAASRAGILTLDAQQDLRFAGAQSVIAQGIRSCLCVPIWADNRILGMLVLDRGFVDPFTADDLELVTVVGYQAALAIERARFLERARESEEARKKLLRHFSPDVANLILSSEQLDVDPLQVSERDEVTVLFSDVKGFTSLTERLAPLELGALLKDYFAAMTGCVFAEKGTLDKFIGDGLMAVFGAPVPQPDGALRAVRCAWAMLERLRELNARLPPDRQVQIRIGVNTGRVIAGNFGSPDRLEFTVLGDTVNTASRLESIAEPGRIDVGRATMERAKAAFRFRPLGQRQVKGKQQTVEVFEVEGPASA